MTIYKTIQGDMWDGIAAKTLGDVNYMDVLMNANAEYRDVYVFSAGIKLTIPDVETVKKSTNLPPWKQVVG